MSEIVMRPIAHGMNRRIQKQPHATQSANETRTLMSEIVMRLERMA